MPTGDADDKTLTPEQRAAADAAKPLSRSDVEAMIAAATKSATDATAAAQARADQAEAARVTAEAARVEADRKATEAAAALETEKTSRMTETEKLARKVSELGEDVRKTREDATKQLNAAELRRYREQKIREEGIQITELVVGTSEAEIDAACVAAKARQDAIAKSVREQIAKEKGEHVPETPAGGGNPQLPNTRPSTVTPLERKTLARLPAAEYEAKRATMLAEAQKGLPANYRRRA